MRPDEGQAEYEEVQKELSSKEEELEVMDYSLLSTIQTCTDILIFSDLFLLPKVHEKNGNPRYFNAKNCYC